MRHEKFASSQVVSIEGNRMKLVRNTGTERVVDLIRPWFNSGNQLDLVTPALSLFAFGEMLADITKLSKARLLLPPEDTELAFIGSAPDRTARTRLQTRWLAKCLAQWLLDKADVRRARGAVPQGAIVLRNGDAHPLKVILGSLAFSTDGLGITPGNPLSLIQTSEAPDEAALLSQWFDAQWNSLPVDPDAKPSVTETLRELAAHRAPFLVYTLILHPLPEDRLREEGVGEGHTVGGPVGARQESEPKLIKYFNRLGL
ncbi:MAG: hypothetical protein HZB82_05120 [Deltaproteobacteria bacterium]|nr:hypothetical protein [Deltaproteobacteria bacterium]